jgi:conjugal transfer/entry exclusion protein
MQLTKRHLLASALALVIAIRPEPAPALLPPIPVFDVARWGDMYLMLKEVEKITAKVRAAQAHIENAAASLGGGNLVDDILSGHRYLTSDIRSISYSIDTVTTQFETLFPNQEAAAHVDPSDVPALQSSWDQEIQQSGLAAARAQTALSRIDSNTRSAMAILERSKATTGGTSDEGSKLAKLQALVQMLGIVNSDLTTLATTLAASERVNSEVAAAEASEQALGDAQVERMLRDYRANQPIPEIDARILRD